MMPGVSGSTPSPLEALTPSQRALLRVAAWVAWADGDFAEEERQLLETLVARLLPPTAAAAGADPASLAAASLAAQAQAQVDAAALVAALEGQEARLQAVKLAVQMMGVNQRPEDAAAINPAEKAAYRQLLEALALPEAEVEQAEWAARQELQRPRSLGELLSATLSHFGAWPAQEDAPLPLGTWL